MTQTEMEDQILRLTAQTLIVRDFTAWFLATLSAASRTDSMIAIRAASESVDRRIDGMNPTSVEQLKMIEMAREEKDWIISTATKILKEA